MQLPDVRTPPKPAGAEDGGIPVLFAFVHHRRRTARRLVGCRMRAFMKTYIALLLALLFAGAAQAQDYPVTASLKGAEGIAGSGQLIDYSVRPVLDRALEPPPPPLQDAAPNSEFSIPGASYNAMNRGDRREAILLDDQDQLLFLGTLGKACRKTDWQIHAWGLMRNHFHLVVPGLDCPESADGGSRTCFMPVVSQAARRRGSAGHVLAAANNQ